MKTVLTYIFSLITIMGFTQTKDSLSLEKAIALALENNYGIITMEKSVEKAELNNSWGAAGALPSLSFTGAGSHSRNYNNTDNFTSKNLNGSVDLNWVLFRGFGARIQKKQLEELEKLTQGNLSLVVENTVVNVILSYYGVLLADEQMKIAHKNMALSEDRYNRQKHQKELGSSSSYFLLQAKNAFLEDKSVHLQAVSSYNNSVRQLNYLMAEPLESNYYFVSEFNAVNESFDLVVLQTRMLENNTTLKNQYINLELAKLDVKSAKSAYYPTISTGLSGGLGSSETIFDVNTMANTNSDAFTASANLAMNYTIYNGGNRKRALQAAKIEEEISQIETTEMQQELSNQLAQELELYNLRKELLILADENLKAAELNFELTQQKFESGAINSFNFRDVQQLYLNAQLNKQNAVYNLAQSYHTLMRLTGGVIDEYKKNN